MAVTLQQIAEACGVSRGTVDRALHGKEGIRPEVAIQIREMAQKMGYIPRRAQPVEAKRKLRIGAVLHSANSEFVQILTGYLRSYSARELLPLETIVRTMAGIDVAHQVALIDELVKEERVDGLVLMPLVSDKIREKINELTEQSIPIVTINTDMEDSGRLAYVGPDLIATGNTAASLLALSMGKQGIVLPIISSENGHYADTQRMTGFLQEMNDHFPDIKVLPAMSCFLDNEMSERITKRVLQEEPELTGIYVSSVGRRGVYRALEQMDMARKIHVVVHDLTENNLRMIERGIVDFAVGQDVRTQGTLPLRMLYQHLTKHAQPEQRINITNIDIKFRCNLHSMDQYRF